MKVFYFGIYSMILVLFILGCKSAPENEKLQSYQPKILGPIFERVPESKSNVHFTNKIIPDLGKNHSVFHYDYFYSGGGVGIADLNNDGLDDIFFTGNQVDNRLYLNKGNLEFEDVTASSGINAGKTWANGVTFADVNYDGLLDIYVCQAGPPGSNRENRLYVNLGGMKFEEKGLTYGLNDPGISTQAVFLTSIKMAIWIAS